MKTKIVLPRGCAVGSILLSVFMAGAALAGGNIDAMNTNNYAWAGNAGWVDFAATNFGGVTVSNVVARNYLSGSAWAENFGWISLGASNATLPYANTDTNNYGVNLDAAGRLSGCAWSKNVGWISFSNTGYQATVDPNTGCFGGYAWGENIGWIHFTNANYNVKTLWRPDTNPPTASMVLSPAVFRANQSGVATITVSEAVTGFVASAITVSGDGIMGAFTTNSASIYAVVVTSGATNGTLTVTIASNAFTDLSGNLLVSNVSASATVDVTAPTVAITFSQFSYVTNQTGYATFAFSEPVTGFDASDIQIAGGTKGAFTTNSSANYRVDVTAGASTGTMTVAIASNALTDVAGNPMASNAQASVTVAAADTTPPTVLSVVFSPTLFRANQSGVATVTVSEAVSNFDVTDVQIANGTVTAFTTNSASEYVVALTAGAVDGLMSLTIPAGSFADLAGNPLVVPGQGTVTVDATAPTVTINQSAGQTDPTNSGPINFTVVFSESVADFATGDVTLSGSAGATTATVTGGGTTYNVAVSGMTGSGTVIASIAAGVAHDAAGNANTGSTSTDNSVTYDITAPTVTINQAAGQADPTNGGPINFTVVFSKPVAGFATGGVTFTGSTAPGMLVGTVSGGGSTYNVAVSGMTGSGTIVATIAVGAAHDMAGNGNTPSSSTDNSVTYDITPPTVTISQAAGQADPTNSGPINFTVVFSESVVDFAAGDVSLSGTAGATTATVTGSGMNYNVAVSGITGGGTVIAAIAAGVAHDAAGNANTASISTDNTVTVDLIAPTASIALSATNFMRNASGVATVTVSEAVSGFSAASFQVSGGTVGDVTLLDTTHYTVAVTAGDGSIPLLTVTLPVGAFTDLAGNPLVASAQATATVSLPPSSGNIDASNKFAWAANAGWVNLAPSDGGVTVHPGPNGYLSGYAWGENVGWLKMGTGPGPYLNDSPTNWGVNLDAAGNLTGYAWNQNAGWVRFDPANGGVQIDAAQLPPHPGLGNFGGYAWGENFGWLHFNEASSLYAARTTAFDWKGAIFLFR